MKKTLIKILIGILCLSTIAFSLVSCKKESDFKLNCYVDGKLYKAVAIMQDGQVEMPSNPKKEGYEFIGWYLDNGTFTEPFNEQELVGTVDKDHSIFAKFEMVFTHDNGTITGLSSYAKNNLIQINIPERIVDVPITAISESAFVSCTKITGVNISKSIVSIGLGAFAGCDSLVSLEVEDGNQVYHADGNCIVETATLKVVAGCKASVVPSYSLGIGSFAFENVDLTTIAIPKNVAEIGEGAFSNCELLETVTFAQETWLTTIGKNAFSNCVKLSSIVIPSGVRTIGNGAFYGCNNLVLVTIPATVLTVGDEAFCECSKLKEVNFTGISALNNLGRRAFYGCAELLSFAVPNDLGEIKTDTFYNCIKLSQVTFGSDSILDRIGDWAFYNCKALTTISLPSTLKSVLANAFNDCVLLEQISFNGSTTLFNEVVLGSDWNLNVSATQVICSDGVVNIK